MDWPLPPVPLSSQCLLTLDALLASSRQQPSDTPLTTSKNVIRDQQAGEEAGQAVPMLTSARAARSSHGGGQTEGNIAHCDGEVLLASINVLNALLWRHCLQVQRRGEGEGDAGASTAAGGLQACEVHQISLLSLDSTSMWTFEAP